MNTYMVGYDKHAGEDYAGLEQAIKNLAGPGLWWHELDSTWLIRHGGACAAIRKSLAAHVTVVDRMLVLRITPDEFGSYGFSRPALAWLHKYV